MTKLVVVGGNAAGMTAASKARRIDPNLEVVVLEQGPDISYSSCGIPHLIGGEVERPSQLLVLSEEEAAERGIEVRTSHRVTAVNPYSKAVAFEGPDGKDDVNYDKLLIASGTEPHNPFPGGDLEGVFTIRHVGDGVRLLHHLREKPTGDVAIVGAGFLGLEMAEAFVRRGSDVHLLARGDRVLTALDEDMTEGLDAWLWQNGVQVHLNAKMQAFEGEGGVLKSVHAADEIPAETAIVATGVRPATGFLGKSGIATDKAGYITVDDQMKTNIHDVWAAGDCVATRHMVTGQLTPMPFALPSNRMGRVAAESITGGRSFFPGVIGTGITRIFGLGFATTGINEQMAKDANIDLASVLIEGQTGAGYMGATGDIGVKLHAEADTGRIVGCQLIGPAESALRINTAALAVQTGMKVDKLAHLESAYAPPFSPVWDPLVVAAGELHKELRK